MLFKTIKMKPDKAATDTSINSKINYSANNPMYQNVKTFFQKCVQKIGKKTFLGLTS